VHHDPVVKHRQTPQPETKRRGKNGNSNGNGGNGNQNANSTAAAQGPKVPTHAITDDAKNALAKIAASTIIAHADEEQPADELVETVAAAPERRNESRNERRNDRRKNQKSQNRDGQSKSSGSDDSVAPGAPAEKTAHVPVAETDGAADAPDSAALSIFDIPLEPTRKPKRVDPRAAEDLLGSVLDALPEPKQPGTGRARRRRVTTAALTGTPVAHDAQGSSPAASE
jgi:ribonuclease E